MRVKNIFFILVFVVGTMSVARAQEYSMHVKTDTVTLRDLVFPTPENPLWQPRTFFPINPSDSAQMANLPPGFLRNEMLSLPLESDDRFDLSSSLKLQWKKDDSGRFFQSALGYLYAGGEAYMVYRALKKYGYIH